MSGVAEDRHGEQGLASDEAGPLRLYWWNGKPNFGDAINPDIVASVSGRQVVWASPAECDLLAIGSVLGFGPVRERLESREHPLPYIWGSGVLNLRPVLDAGAELPSRIKALRGPFTAQRLPGYSGPFGDPGLLVSRVQPAVNARSGIGLVPHHQQWNEPAQIDQLRSAGFRLIDVRLADPWEVVRQIAGCEAVISTSLHGLIVADAYGVPNVWLDGLDPFKFYDYFYSVRRGDRRARSLSEALHEVETGAARAADRDVVAEVQRQLVEAFPQELCARARRERSMQ